MVGLRRPRRRPRSPILRAGHDHDPDPAARKADELDRRAQPAASHRTQPAAVDVDPGADQPTTPWLPQPDSQRLTARLQGLAIRTAREAERALANAARPSGRRAPGPGPGGPIDPRAAGAERVIAQTATRRTGQRTIPDRLISLADRDARPIRRGKPRAPTEFGYKPAFAGSPEGVVVSHRVYAGNPAAVHTLEAAVAAAQAVGGGQHVTLRRHQTGARDVLGRRDGRLTYLNA